ncbi:MAG: sigma-70 family RNA polymerase sigma factor [Prevotellaceae bacterium]|nr:sigma-70 family RNA polymerase sigma factor [Prevotellaceae bacterium]
MEKFSSLPDEQLVSMYKEGNNEAFDALLAHNQDRVFQYISFMVGGNEDVANDVFQDTFVKAIMAIRDGHYQESGQFGAWLLRIARNIILDQERSTRSFRTTSNELTGQDGETKMDLLNNQALSEPNAEMKMVCEQSLSDVRMMVDLLPEPQREVVILRFFQDMPFKDIASLTNVSINTALGRMRYALINLRRMAQHRNLYLAD